MARSVGYTDEEVAARAEASDWPMLEDLTERLGDLYAKCEAVAEDSEKAIAYHETILSDLRAARDVARATQAAINTAREADPRNGMTMPTRAARY